MQVTKWEMIDAYSASKNGKNRNELLEEGWEPFAAYNSGGVMFRRPVGYIEVEEKIVKQNGEIKPEQIITKEVTFNLDEIFKSRKNDCQ